MRSTVVACALVAALGAGPAAAADLAALPERTAAMPPKEAAKLVSRSLWAVVPAAPRRKRDVRPELATGTAVAVSGDTLLVACRALAGRSRVGLVRRNKYYRASLSGRARPAGREVCELRARDAPLRPVRGFRELADLDAGEPVYALATSDGVTFATAEGRLTGGRRGPGGSRLGTSLQLPAGPQGAVLFDGRGNLVGLAVPGAVRRAVPGVAAGAAGPPGAADPVGR